MTQGIRTSLLFLLSVCSSSWAPPLFLTKNGALMHTFNLLKWGSKGSELLSGFGDQDQTRGLRDSIQPLPGWAGVTMATLCGPGAPGHLTSNPHFFLIPLALGQSWVPWDTRPHPAFFTPPSVAGEASQGREREDQRRDHRS